MNVLSSFAPASSFQIGIRAFSRRRRHPERLLCGAAIRTFSRTTGNILSQSCYEYSLFGASSPTRRLKDSKLRCYKLWPRTQTRTLGKLMQPGKYTFRAILHYTDLHDTYEDADGLEFRKEDLSQREVNAIFGPHISARDANRLLKIIHGRRVAGSLDDPDLQQNTSHYSTADKIKALEYLRKNIPVDEVINAGLRAEDELRLIEEQENELQDAEEQFEETSSQTLPAEPEPKLEPEPEPTTPQTPFSETKSEPEPEIATAPGKLPRKPQSDSPYGESTFDRIRKRNIALREAEEKRQEEERIKREHDEALGNIGTLQTDQAQPRAVSPWRQKHTERATSDLQAPPEMKVWERLLPMVAMTALILGGCAAFAVMYKPPQRDWRVWPEIPPAAATCLGLIMMNMSIWMLWKFPPAWAVFNRYMMVVAATPRPLQLVGAIFSHHGFGHLTGNMIALFFFGIRLHDEIGRGNFLALYFASGAVGFLASVSHLVLIRGLEFTTLGASGAVYGLIVAYFWMHKYDEFKIFGLPPDPMQAPQGLAFLAVLVGVHIFGLFSKSARAAKLDLPSHLGGMLAGGVGIEMVKRHMDEKARVRAEKLKTMGVLDKAMDHRQKPKPDTPDIMDKVIGLKEHPRPFGS
ncbi:uncharacterized protein BCR38DRAFT_449319 [Pseudomassariella vexata]|uniref:Peptidase S54 rhomboid domain-containing protein n=1 Tax=Pseudomassariella vexata TaxID=1141098 RepID=A0A1Y2DEG1_9PEZI|nr:uncharacterized protein BCR38DRAFT_449319 [Pseudomassariella vexata]ORY57516.1 hypothetical protein BCR38DRAFT_449319 [Pseudomassariella vexata]